jgi:hypothetical protein
MRLKPLVLAISLLVITSLPQIYLCYERGSKWQGSFTYFDTDELTYAAYVNALKEGRARRSDPYTGVDDQHFETLYSIQFVPAYAIAFTTRCLHVSTSTAFIVLTPLITAASFVLIYFLLFALTHRSLLSAIGAFTTLSLGGFLALPPWEVFGSHSLLFPFLRRYEPAVPFPVFFGVALCVYYALTKKSLRWAVGAGVLTAILIFSYFYLWTAAAAWLFVLMLLWLWRVDDRRHTFKVFGIIAALGGLALIPYGLLLSHRIAATDQAQLLESTRLPDLLRGPEIYSVILLICLARKHATREILFGSSFLIAPLVLFNQQIITGRSLQPFHYQEFIANYWIGIAICLAVAQLRIPKRVRTIAAFAPTIVGTWLAAVFASGTLQHNVEFDRAVGSIYQVNGPGVVFSPNRYVSTSVPIYRSNPIVWSRYLYTYSTLNFSEQTKRLYRYLYYSGVSPAEFREMLNDEERLTEVFGYRASPLVTRTLSPITRKDIDAAVKMYATIVSNFNNEDAVNPELSYAILSVTDSTQNLDLWYERNEIGRADGFVIYKLSLKLQPFESQVALPFK